MGRKKKDVAADALYQLHKAAINYGRALDFREGGKSVGKAATALKSAARVYRWEYEKCEVDERTKRRHQLQAMNGEKQDG